MGAPEMRLITSSDDENFKWITRDPCHTSSGVVCTLGFVMTEQALPNVNFLLDSLLIDVAAYHHYHHHPSVTKYYSLRRYESNSKRLNGGDLEWLRSLKVISNFTIRQNALTFYSLSIKTMHICGTECNPLHLYLTKFTEIWAFFAAESE